MRPDGYCGVGAEELGALEDPASGVGLTEPLVVSGALGAGAAVVLSVVDEELGAEELGAEELGIEELGIEELGAPSVVVAEALALAPVEAIDEPDHQSLLARSLGEAAR
jgi:hypothetical protein